MAILTTKVAQRFTGIATGIACVVNSMKIFDVGQLVVFVNDTEEEAIINVDYTAVIAGDKSGVTVTPLALLTARTTIITVARRTPSTADYALTINGKFSEDRLSEQVDRQIMRHQESISAFSRSIKVPLGEELDSLPAAAGRANGVLTFDQDGNVFIRPITETINLVGYTKYIEDYPTVQACIDAVQAYGGGVVSCRPNAAIDVSTRLLVTAKNVKIDLGQGAYFNSTSLLNDILVVGDGATQVENFETGNIDFWASVNKTAGRCMWLRKVVNSWLDKRMVFGQRWRYEAASKTSPLWDGVHADEFGDLVFSEGMEGYGLATGFKANGNASGLFGAEVTIGGKSHFIDNTIHIHIAGGVGGFYPGRFSVSEGAQGVLVDKTGAAVNNREIWTSQMVLDNIVGHAINFEADSARYWQHVDAWVSGCGRLTGALPSIRVATGNDNLRSLVEASFVKASAARGIEVSSGFVDLKGVHGTGNADDFLYCAGAATRVYVDNCTIDNNGGWGIDASGMTGAAVLEMADSRFFSNAAGNVNEPAGGTFNPRNNTGYVTENQVIATITAGNTTATVAHGLARVPRYPSVTPIGALGVGFGVQNLTSTTVQVAISSVLGSDVSFVVDFS